MLLDKPKKNRGIKLVKLDQQYFKNTKRYQNKLSSISIINKEPLKKGKSLRYSINESKRKNEEERKPATSSNITNKKYKKMYSCNRLVSSNFNELLFLRNILRKKEEEKKDIEKSLSRFSKSNQSKFFSRKSFSCKDIKNLRNNLLNKKSRIINNINIMNSNNNICSVNNNEFNSNQNTNNKTNTFINDVNKENNVNNNDNKFNDCNIVNVIKIKNENLTDHSHNNDTNIKNGLNNFKKFFCCLYNCLYD